ncbi:MAG: hypothetical protein AABY09_02435 [Nanoarchaeota archaeon]
MEKSETIISKEIKELVIARLSAMPEHMKLSIGSQGDFDKYELMDHVNKMDAIGRKIINVQMHYLQALKRGLK